MNTHSFAGATVAHNHENIHSVAGLIIEKMSSKTIYTAKIIG